MESKSPRPSGGHNKNSYNTGSKRPTVSVVSSECIVQVTFHDIFLTDECLEHLALNYYDDVVLQLEWMFMSDKGMSPKMKLTDTCRTTIEYVHSHKMELNLELLKYILYKKIQFVLVAIDEVRSNKLASSELVMEDMLQNLYLEDISIPLLLIDDPAIKCAEVGISLNMKCHTTLLENLKQLVGTTHRSSTEYLTENEKKYYKLLHPTKSELKAFQEGLDLVLLRNKALKTTQNEISTELRDRAKWLHEECNWKRSLQEYAILTNNNPSEIPWRQWRVQATAKIALRNYSERVVIYEPELVITILSLLLFKDTSLMENEDILKLYIEYSFMSKEGADMETPHSLPKTSENHIVYNFENKFSLDTTTNMMECEKLASKILNKENLRFHVISEPIKDVNCSSVVTCYTIGYSEVGIFDLVDMQENEKTFNLPVMNIRNENDIFGEMKINFKGLLAMRKMALTLLAPPDYKIIQ